MIRSTVIAILVSGVVVSAQDWPAFRGPNGDGVSTSKSAPLNWDRKTNIKWQVAMPKPGNGQRSVSPPRWQEHGASDPGRQGEDAPR